VEFSVRNPSFGSRATAEGPPAEAFQQWTTIEAAWQAKPELPEGSWTRILRLAQSAGI
jgi:hypothetical protein